MFDYPVDIGILIISSNERTRLTDEILNESIWNIEQNTPKEYAEIKKFFNLDFNFKIRLD